MVLKKYSIDHIPTPKDKNRYKLNLACTDADVKEIVKKLSNISSRAFPATDKDYKWSVFLYELTDNMVDKLKSELDKVVSLKEEFKDSPPEEAADEGQKKDIEEETPAKVIPARLNADYAFENFVVGANTRFTYAACKSVAENPGKNYNPLFIYGGVGLGKTHLMQAIGNYVRKKFPEFAILYFTTDEFVHEVVDAIENGTLNNMRAKYKAIDLLLIDDIQFLERSESTQEEFFHIFNEMYEVEKQIVIISDKPPKKLLTLEDRLKSRFEWGLTTDIKSPNFETRKAIINKKSEKAGIELTDEISDYIAERLTSNIRELEGIINRIYAYQQLSEDEITIDFIKDIIRNILPAEEEDEKEAKKESPAEKPAVVSPQPATPQPPYSLPPPQSSPFSPLQHPANLCSMCGGQLTFVPQYQKWYCANCRIYADQVRTFPPPYQQPPGTVPSSPPQAPGIQKTCKRCNLPLMYVSEYDKFYCTNCKEYEADASASPPPAPAAPPPAPAASPPAPEVKKVEVKVRQPEKKPEKKQQKIEEKGFEEKIIGEEKKDIREIRTGYFLPEGAKELFTSIVHKLNKLTTQKKFNFYIRPLFTSYYSTDLDINFDKIAHIASTNNIDIALCLQPGKETSVNLEAFKKKLAQAMDKESMPFEIIHQEEMKESDALNFLLDIAICAKKGNRE